ncbi:hypothetical protein scyTo_0005537 [Scyliorhinus torazame]|uniref:Uncharacterized protein n=1 Tax=Scyliorhinus torazame TaxID=75743 RepID=A0A401P9H2_SCYTO|nr:hypothetical protein [Scyliorhinus torazame]
MDVTNELTRAVEETSPDITIVIEEQNEVIKTNQDTEDTLSCNDISTPSMDSCFEANTGSKVMNESSHESSQQSHTQELDNMHQAPRNEDKVFMVHCDQSEEAEDTSPDLTRVTEEQSIVIETNKVTVDTTNCNNIITSSSESCSEANSGLDTMNKSLQEPQQQATALEVDDVQRMQEDDVNTGPVVMHKCLQEPPQRATSQELDDVQRIQKDEVKTGSEAMNKGLQAPLKRAIALEVDDVQKIQEDEVNIGSEAMHKCLQEFPQRTTSLELDDVQKMQKDEVKTGPETMNKNHQGHLQRATTLEVNDVQRMQEDEANTGPEAMYKCLQEPPQRSSSLELDDGQRMQKDELNTGPETTNKGHQEPLEQTTTLEVNDVQRMQEDEVNTGPETVNKGFQEPPQRATTVAPDDVQIMQEGEDKMLQTQNINKGANTNQSSFNKTTELDQNKNNEEKQTLEAELQKCIDDLKKLKIPSTFLKKQRHWQNELLKKYDV